MRTLLICMLCVFFGAAAKAQQATASLGIMLSDIQSVSLTGKDIPAATNVTAETSQNAAIKLLSRSTSQVKKIWVKATVYQQAVLKNEAVQPVTAIADQKNYLAANSSRPKTDDDPLHVVYQIDPL